MKKTWGIVVLVWLVLSLALAGCGRNGASDPSCRDATCHVSPLSEIDSLMWQRPDTALTVLVDYLTNDTVPAATSQGRFPDHYAQLLASELLYKNDCEQTNRKDLLLAVDYFDSLRACSNDLAFLDARAHYIKGVGSYERDSVVDACREYLQALEVMEDWFDEKELTGHKARFMALVYTRLYSLFSHQYLHEQAILFAKRSLPYYRKLEASWQVPWMLEEIGSHYDMMDQLDSADYYYHRAFANISDTLSLLHRDIKARHSFLHYKLDKDPVVPLETLYNLLDHSKSQKEFTARCLGIGEIYFHQLQYDSAWKYLNIVFLQSSSTASKKQAAEWLVGICKIQNRIEQQKQFADYLVPFANQNEKQGIIKSQLSEQFSQYEGKVHEWSHNRKMKKQKFFVLMGILGLAFVVVIVFGVAKRIRKKEKKIHEKQIEDLTRQFKAKTFFDEPICVNILSIVNDNAFKSKIDYGNYKDYALDKQQLLELRNSAESHFGTAFKTLLNDYPQLTDDDLIYCCLYLLGLENADVAALMQRDFSTICSRKKKLQKIFNSEQSLSLTLKRLLIV